MRRGVFMYAHLRFSSPYPAATLCPPPREGLQGAQFSPRRDADDAPHTVCPRVRSPEQKEYGAYVLTVSLRGEGLFFQVRRQSAATPVG